MTKRWRAFENAFSVSAEDMEFELRGLASVPWSEFVLNPRRLRGSDFLMRWSQGVWSEERLVQAVNQTASYYALPYGPSGVAPDNDPREFELYFERLEEAGLRNLKRPDLLIFRKEDQPVVEQVVQHVGGRRELPFTPEEDLCELLSRAVIAVECENSLWKAAQMPDYGKELTPQKRLSGKLGLKKSAVVPTVILKEEDRRPLLNWQLSAGVAIHVWHVFFDLAFGLALSDAERLISEGAIQPTEQVFQAPGGATTKKVIYKIYYHYAYPLGGSRSEPTPSAEYLVDKNGHILPYVKFVGGTLNLSGEALQVLHSIQTRSS